MIHKNLDGIIPSKCLHTSKENELIKKSEDIIYESIDLMNNQKIHEYIKLVWDLVNDTNKYFNDQKPWELLKNDIDSFKAVMNNTCELIKRIAILIYPIMPDTSYKILSMLNLSEIEISFSSINKYELDNIKINPLSQLFPRIG